jgi:ribonuclease T2
MSPLKITLRAAALALFGLLTIPAASAEPAGGSLLAVRGCPAYISKNKLTNPDRIKLAPGTAYPVLEQNRAGNPDWYRIRIVGARPAERWVSADCGRYSAVAPPGGPVEEEEETGGNGGLAAHCPSVGPRPVCNTCGRGESYVLAVSWQPAFCETVARNELDEKPECRVEDESAYQASHFTLHGLWPNRHECHRDYGFCGPVTHKEANFLQYPPVTLKTAARDGLAEVMPSVALGSGLERHEWHKHGTCSGLTADDYFGRAAELTRQFNRSGLADFMSRNVGRQVTVAEFLNRVDAALGAGARDRVRLECGKPGLLTEVQINLPLRTPSGGDLQTLVAEAAPQGGVDRDCGSRFLVDRIGRGNAGR